MQACNVLRAHSASQTCAINSRLSNMRYEFIGKTLVTAEIMKRQMRGIPDQPALFFINTRQLVVHQGCALRDDMNMQVQSSREAMLPHLASRQDYGSSRADEEAVKEANNSNT
eukprot:16695-Heterococcus_DN1.PRE.2